MPEVTGPGILPGLCFYSYKPNNRFTRASPP